MARFDTLAGFATQEPDHGYRLAEAQELSLVPLARAGCASAHPQLPVRGPGWFDSSWDLRSGCEVREGWPGDGSLREWITGWLHPAGGGSWSESFSAT